MTITVYSKPNCPQCVMTKKHLQQRGVDFKEVDISVDDQAKEQVSTLGYRQVPVVHVGDEHWGGFRPDRLNAICTSNIA